MAHTYKFSLGRRKYNICTLPDSAAIEKQMLYKPKNKKPRKPIMPFVYKPNTPKGMEGKTKEEKLAFLIRMSSYKTTNSIPYKTRRAKKVGATGPCIVCNGKARCRHHIISLKNGGSNKAKNLVNICDSCHKIIHPWLQRSTS